MFNVSKDFFFLVFEFFFFISSLSILLVIVEIEQNVNRRFYLFLRNKYNKVLFFLRTELIQSIN